jgi:hypothetical protein
VLEAGAGIPVTEVAERYRVSRQSVHTWLARYRQEGIAGLEDRSHRVHHHPWRIAAGVEELFLSQWLAHDPARLGDSLAQFVGHPAYGLAQLRGDLQRFVFLLGGSDGQALFGPGTAQ